MLLNYLPNFMQNILEIEKIMEISEPEINHINTHIENILKDLFIIGCSETATIHYEEMLQVIPKLTDTLEKRQYDILSIYNQTLPFTLESLQEKLDAICGTDGYTLELLYDKFILNIKLELNKKELFITVSNLLEWIVPLNIKINLNINYNIWRDLTGYTWGNVKIYRWGEIKELEEIRNK